MKPIEEAAKQKENLIREIIKIARQPKRKVIDGDELTGKVIYQHHTEQEIVDLFLPKLADVQESKPMDIEGLRKLMIQFNSFLWNKGHVQFGKVAYSDMLVFCEDFLNEHGKDFISKLPNIKAEGETQEKSCAICGYFCDNSHHSDSWFDVSPLPKTK